MKKTLVYIFSLLFILISFSGCKNAIHNFKNFGNSKNTVETQASTNTEATTSQTTLPKEILPLPQKTMEFYFLSGAGAWRTNLTLNQDGTFAGMYLDSEAGSYDTAYPNGTAYICSFSGSFDNIKKVNDYSYTMELKDIKTENTIGEEWIDSGIRYIASEPYGLDGGNMFIFYLPDTPTNSLSEEFLSWCPYRYDMYDSPKDTLSCYGILNIETSCGFFSEQ